LRGRSTGRQIVATTRHRHRAGNPPPRLIGFPVLPKFHRNVRGVKCLPNRKPFVTFSGAFPAPLPACLPASRQAV
jgi:hypothetical protein